MQSIEIFFLFFYPSKLHTYILSLWLNMFHLMAVIRRHDRYQKKNNIVDTHTQTTTRKIQNECLNTHTLINKNTFTRKKRNEKKTQTATAAATYLMMISRLIFESYYNSNQPMMIQLNDDAMLSATHKHQRRDQCVKDKKKFTLWQ